MTGNSITSHKVEKAKKKKWRIQKGHVEMRKAAAGCVSRWQDDGACKASIDFYPHAASALFWFGLGHRAYE